MNSELLLVGPFVLLLLLIAIAPLFFPDWWSKHYPKVSFGLGGVVILYYVFSLQRTEIVLHTGQEYFSFIVLIGSLFIVSGGINISTKDLTSPRENLLFLLVGAIIANLVGTTGASMLLIRPWIRMNKVRIAPYHIVFFIFIVSNVGGALTPIGDPPLFIGYLKGIPFFWVIARTFPMWCVGVGILLLMFYLLDRKNYESASRAVQKKIEKQDEWKIEGLNNILFLLIILAAVFISSPPFLREAVIIIAAIASYVTTKKTIHHANHFTFHPIQEVAIIFAGIFATMIPALELLSSSASTMNHLSTMGNVHDNTLPVQTLLLSDEFSRHIVAISVGAVFFGANTYIGNGPNFMVKSIADHYHVPTPSFVRYITHFTLPFMLPMLFVVWILFFL
ncbi:MAG: sodium:proton antiporter [Ignavibacteriales bacterium]|nr:sodium:proton antiporter [Ignavibacteriales bacterium]